MQININITNISSSYCRSEWNNAGEDGKVHCVLQLQQLEGAGNAGTADAGERAEPPVRNSPPSR